MSWYSRIISGRESLSYCTNGNPDMNTPAKKCGDKTPLPGAKVWVEHRICRYRAAWGSHFTSLTPGLPSVK